MSARLKTPPVNEPMSLQEAKDHLKVDLVDDDSYIDPLITAARLEAEDFMERALVTQTWELFLDCFPATTWHPILVPRPPLLSITSIKYIDTDGIEQTWAASEYKVDTASTPGRIYPAFGKSWPSTRLEANAVTIEFLAGYGPNAQDVPENIVHAIKLILSDRYEHRGSIAAGFKAELIPNSAQALMNRYRDFRF